MPLFHFRINTLLYGNTDTTHLPFTTDSDSAILCTWCIPLELSDSLKVCDRVHMYTTALASYRRKEHANLCRPRLPSSVFHFYEASSFSTLMLEHASSLHASLPFKPAPLPQHQRFLSSSVPPLNTSPQYLPGGAYPIGGPYPGGGAPPPYLTGAGATSYPS